MYLAKAIAAMMNNLLPPFLLLSPIGKVINAIANKGSGKGERKGEQAITHRSRCRRPAPHAVKRTKRGLGATEEKPI